MKSLMNLRKRIQAMIRKIMGKQMDMKGLT